MMKKYSRKRNKLIKTIKTIKNTKQITPTEHFKLISLANMNSKQLEELSHITQDTNIMKYIGKGNIWTMRDLKQYMLDEKKEIRKNILQRQYYSFILIKDTTVIGFIAGRKNTKLLPLSEYSPYDLLLRMFISSKHSGQGYGKLILKLFIEKYRQILSSYIHKNIIKLVSDIDENNISSIKIHLVNGFQFIKNIKYPNKHIYKRYEIKLTPIR